MCPQGPRTTAGGGIGNRKSTTVPAPGHEELTGSIERVTFHNPENGFCVLRVKARGYRDLVTAVGHSAQISPGEWITASGEWINDRNHGLQFRARFFRTTSPASLHGMEKYLGSGMITGIGPVYAGRLVRHFAEKVFDVIEASPEKLREVEGIGPKRAARITDAWSEQKVIREIMVFLHQHGVGTTRAVRIFKTYGAAAVQIVSEDQYRLAREIRGIGFRTADHIAARLGIARTAMIRIRAGISFALAEAMGKGHCGLPATELEALAVKLLEVPEDLVAAALELELSTQNLTADRVAETPCVFLSGLYQAEKAIAAHLHRLATMTPPWPAIDTGKALPWVEARTGLSLAAGQAEAVRLVLRSKVPDHAAVLLVGDIDQLPSVGPGQVLADIIRSGAVAVIRLTEVFRQAANSRIVTNAHRINAGNMPDLKTDADDGDFYYVPAADPAQAVERILTLVRERIPRRFGLDPVSDIQVLCPMNRAGGGARSLNVELQAALNPAGEPTVERFGWTFAPGDKVMQIQNDYDKDVYNGDIGFVGSVDAEDGELTVNFDARNVSYGFGELDMLVPAYATTIHKSQGSEYPAVVIPVLTQHYAMLQRNLLYTGITRGKRLVVLVGQHRAIAIAVRNVSGRRRWSKLKEWLQAPR